MQRVHQTHEHWLINKNMNITQGLISKNVEETKKLCARKLLDLSVPVLGIQCLPFCPGTTKCH